jgi:tRNA 5-methylaminomethyl-2-thiouridine biosynthesis bifunctional protein
MSTSDQPALSPYQMPAPQLQWGEDGAPFSQQFDDIYFSREDGLAETDYVFLQQNRLAERWAALDPQQAGVFVIGETGFGTGLNFFCAWQLWQTVAPKSWRLHFISVEKFPLEREQLQRALQQWPQFAAQSAELLENYPTRIPGHHLLQLSDSVALQLIFDDAVSAFADLHDSAASDLRNGFKIDAWFLDGFAPAKNPAMWSTELFAHIGRLSRPGTSFATFTVAGPVKRGLIEAGFRIEKIAGFGNKRQMLRGVFDTAPAVLSSAPKPRYRAIDYWAYPPHSPATQASTQTAIIIGGGLAGTSTARALAERGWSVTLLEREATLASGASGNPSGVLYTKLSTQAGTLNRFARCVFIGACCATEKQTTASCAAYCNWLTTKRNGSVCARPSPATTSGCNVSMRSAPAN